MEFLLAVAFLSSCANLKHATSTNLSEVKHFRNNHAQIDYWNTKVATLKNGEEANCKLIGDIKGKDNVFDAGAEFAVLYMKINANKLGADSILVKWTKNIGNYGNEAFGNAYLCKPIESK